MKKFNDLEKEAMLFSLIVTLILVAIVMNVFRDEIKEKYFKTEIKNN